MWKHNFNENDYLYHQGTIEFMLVNLYTFLPRRQNERFNIFKKDEI